MAVYEDVHKEYVFDDGQHEYDDILSTIDNEKRMREPINAKWLELWHLYKTEPLRVASEGEWHSKLNDGRTFEVIETVACYVRNALFYSDSWVTLEAREPGLAEIVPLASAYFRDCLNNSNLKREFRLFIAQLLLLGTSVMSVDWVDDKLTFECLNMYDCYIESNRRYDAKTSFAFRTHELNYADFLQMYELFDKLEDESQEEAFERLHNASEKNNEGKLQLSDTVERPDERYVTLVEYFCPIEQMLHYFVDNECVGSRQSKECPWLFTTLIETPGSAYSLSLIDSSIGLILENNVLMNRRLDNIAISVDNMWMFVDDGVTNPDDIKTAPGKVIVVGRPDSVQPMHPPHNNFNVTYTEAQVLDTKIDRNVGTGAMISANAYRTGERVTATEVRSVKDAGGNRLTDLYEHIEFNAVLPILNRAYTLVKKNTKSSKVVSLPGKEQGSKDYFQMLPEDLSYDYKVRLSATQSVINRDREVQTLTDFLTLIANIPQFQELVNYRNLYYDLLTKFGFDDPSRYIMQEKEEEPVPQQQTPLGQAASTMESIAPGSGASAVQGMVAGGQLPQMMADIAGIPPQQQSQMTPEMEQQLMAAANMPV